MQERRLLHGRIAFRWLEAGDGIPVVLVHGIPTSPELWRHVAPRLDGARVLAWELVGYGRSSEAARGEDISVAAQAAHLLTWLDAVGIERAVMVGHDLAAASCRSPRCASRTAAPRSC